jgi:hypothetical protein
MHRPPSCKPPPSEKRPITSRPMLQGTRGQFDDGQQQQQLTRTHHRQQASPKLNGWSVLSTSSLAGSMTCCPEATCAQHTPA